jgi:hypothetical protein
VLELRRSDVDSDDPLCAAQQRPLHRCEADAAAADHGDGGSRLDGRGPERRSRARREAAGEQRRLLDRQLLRHPHGARLVHDRLVGERAAPQHRRQQRAVGGPA